jgi:hypothetical protein
MRSSSVSLLIASSLLFAVPIASAGLFPDVADGNLFRAEIESLVRAGVIKGNPDGTFKPQKSVNRAEFLKMLYSATGKTPRSVNVACFADVEAGSWYESFVCDAAAKENGFVKGYSDGKFRPASPVSRTEALKMVFMVFGLSAPDITESDKAIIKFVDVSPSAWYAKYLSAAYNQGLFPIAGFNGTRLNPDQELRREEAAAYIYNAARVLEAQNMKSSSASSVAAESAQAMSSSSSTRTEIMKKVTFPFYDEDQFIEKNPAAYVFTLGAKTDVEIRVTVSGFYTSDVSCRLYRLDNDGFSNEYYLGYQEAGVCTVHATVGSGRYQLQLQPTVKGVPYAVTAKTYVSDGNDGFVDAVPLKINMPKTEILGPSDLIDWYSFSFTAQTNATLEISAGEPITCIIYTPASVDQFGFSGPECNKSYLFGVNDIDTPYLVGIGRKQGDMFHKIPYTVNLH